jgi:hypothetical protein
MDKKIDTIREKCFDPLENAERAQSVLFYMSAALSFVVPLIDKTLYLAGYNVAQIFFLISVSALSIVSLAIRLYFSPRAQEYRYKDFLSHAYGVQLSDEQTNGYYNNTESVPARRIAAQTLENSFYSKRTVAEMAKSERVRACLYFLVWLIVILNRNTDLAFIAIVAQLFFGEQILSRWLRIEWLKDKFERTFDDSLRLVQSKVADNLFEVSALEITGKYEMAKTNAGITLSSKVFDRHCEETDKKWEEIRKSAGI